jgi:hypothetical protein
MVAQDQWVSVKWRLRSLFHARLASPTEEGRMHKGSKILSIATSAALLISPAAAWDRCGKVVFSDMQCATAPQPGGMLKVIRGQHTEVMWQGIAAIPDRGFNDTCTKEHGKVVKHDDGKWYCDLPSAAPQKH